MSEGSNLVIDFIPEKTSPNLDNNFQESFSSSNQSNNDFETTKSVNNQMTNPTKLISHNNNTQIKALFNSENLETKINSPSYSLKRKFDFQKTDPNYNSETNLISPKKKKMSMFKMVQKSKYKKFFETPLTYTKKEDEENETGRERRDAFGNMINKKNKRKIKVSFADELKEEKPLVSVINIESFKKYNIILGMPSENTLNKNMSANCQCCSIY